MTKKPTVIFMVPSVDPDLHAAVMNQLTVQVANDLGWEPSSITMIGLVSATAEHGAEGIYFLEEIGVDPRALTLMVFWGETASAVKFDDVVAEECGIGGIFLPASGVVLPVLRMPNVHSKWWLDPLHVEYASVRYASMIQDGKSKLQGSEPLAYVANKYAWN